MSNLKKILDSFKLKDSLNPKVWENPKDPKEATMKSKVREALMKISEEFVDDLGDDVFVEDVFLMGSLANFNWSEFSDFDLHVIVDTDRYGKEKDLYVELFDLKKKLFNSKHDIKIYGYDVELYAQGSTDEHYSDGVFSVFNNEWVNRPTKKRLDLNMSVLKDKIECWTEKIDDAIENAKETKNTEPLKRLKDKLKDYRQSGLSQEGEFSYENLVFKYLRRSGHIGKLFDIKNKMKDKELSIERKITEQIDELKPKDLISKSTFLSSLMDLIENRAKFEYTPGQKLIKDKDVVKIQEALQYLGFLLPKYGVDGKFGEETRGAVIDFQEKYDLDKTGKVDDSNLKFLIAALIVKEFNDTKLSTIEYQGEPTDDKFTYLDLNDPIGYTTYKKICQAFIDSRNTNAFVSGDMMANCAKKYFSQGYIPPELALAQLTLEGGLSKVLTAKPIKTKNPFNVGNTDSGKLNYQDSFQDGVCLYYDLMTKSYLTKGKTAKDLLQNFVNVRGNRYASSDEYEQDLGSLVNSIKKVTEPIA